MHFRYEFHQHVRRLIKWDRIWGGTALGLLYLMIAFPFMHEPALGWLAMVALCTVLLGPVVYFLLPASWQEFRESGGHHAGGLIFCAVMIEAILVRLVVVLPLDGFVFAWLNRITVFVALPLLVAWSVNGFRARVERPDGTSRHLWVFGVIALVFLAAFLSFWRVRILDAFWLR